MIKYCPFSNTIHEQQSCSRGRGVPEYTLVILTYEANNQLQPTSALTKMAKVATKNKKLGYSVINLTNQW